MLYEVFTVIKYSRKAPGKNQTIDYLVHFSASKSSRILKIKQMN